MDLLKFYAEKMKILFIQLETEQKLRPKKELQIIYFNSVQTQNQHIEYKFYTTGQ